MCIIQGMCQYREGNAIKQLCLNPALQDDSKEVIVFVCIEFCFYFVTNYYIMILNKILLHT